MATARSGHATYYLDVGLVSQNQAGNYSTLQVHIYAVADSGWSGNSSGNSWSCYGGSGAFNISGASVEIANYYVNVGHDGNGYCNYAFTASVGATGTSTYGGPISWTQSGSLPRIPKVPSAPGVSVAAQSGRSVTLSVSGSADNGGSGITAYHIAYSYNGGGWTGDRTDWGTPYTNLAPGNYVFSAYATNGVGNSARSQTGTVVIRSGGKRWTGSAWTPTATAKRFTGSAWTDLTIARRYDGSKWVDLS